MHKYTYIHVHVGGPCYILYTCTYMYIYTCVHAIIHIVERLMYRLWGGSSKGEGYKVVGARNVCSCHALYIARHGL